MNVDEALLVYRAYVQFVKGEVNLPPSVADRVEAANVLNRILDLAEIGTRHRLGRPQFPYPPSPKEAAEEASQIYERFDTIMFAAGLECGLPDAPLSKVGVAKV